MSKKDSKKEGFGYFQSMWAWFGGAGRRDELKIYEMCSKVDSLAYDLFKENLKTKRIIRKWEKFLKANSKDLKEPYSKFEKLKRIQLI